MHLPQPLHPGHMAPCGVLCPACSAYQAAKNPCPGCRAPAEAQKRKSCRNCVKKACATEKGLDWCFQCPQFPCARIKSLNQRYTEHYDVDLVQNGEDAQADMDAFLKAQMQRFTCPACGAALDQHHRRCSECAGLK